MTNYEKVKSMTTDELAELIVYTDIEDTPWVKWFYEKYCKKCKTTKAIFPSGRTDNFHECDFEGVCPYHKNTKDIVKLWLESSTR